MKKPTYKRLGLGMIQHLAAMLILMIIAGVTLNTNVSCNTLNGRDSLELDFFGENTGFEESKLFREILEKEIPDIIRLAIIREQLETDGEFDPDKAIDITQFAGRKGMNNGCPVTATYRLMDLIEWGRDEGINYVSKTENIMDFIMEYGGWSNFSLDDNHQVYFAGFDGYKILEQLDETMPQWMEPYQDLPLDEKKDLYIGHLVNALNNYSDEQCCNMVLAYLEEHAPNYFTSYKDEDGTVVINYNRLKCKYPTVDGSMSLSDVTDNWLDEMRLQENLVDTIQSVSINYAEYDAQAYLYERQNNNIRYFIQKEMKDGVHSVTNISELIGKKDVELTEYFSEFGRFLVYYPKNQEYRGNTGIPEKNISALFDDYKYAYPDNTRIWVGVDTRYPVEYDNFSDAQKIYARIVPYTKYIIATVVGLVLIWIVLLLYLSVNAGNALDSNQNPVIYINQFDRMWLEFSVISFLAICYFSVIFQEILEETRFHHVFDFTPTGTDKLYLYLFHGLVGFFSSMFVCAFWYSFVRRYKYGYLWKGSFLYWLIGRAKENIGNMMRHGSVAVATLLPYNLFLFVNVGCLFLAYTLRDYSGISFAIVVLMVILDGIIGMLLFKSNSEKRDIVEGIDRIRNGEVDYKLNLDALHGSNREMADAVNNIGEGIRNAVATSIKDERLKTDLITNVSHDLKTPLTSIMNYVDLLKRLRIKEEPAKTYIEVLDGKSQRLKQLTDDLLEASKLSSGTVEFHCERLNLTELLNQSVGEFGEKLEERGLNLIFEGSDLPAYIYADSQKM